jgi:hypothetical protein
MSVRRETWLIANLPEGEVQIMSHNFPSERPGINQFIALDLQLLDPTTQLTTWPFLTALVELYGGRLEETATHA